MNNEHQSSVTEIPEFDAPQPWSGLIRQPTPTNVQEVCRLLEAEDSDRATRAIERLANLDLAVVGEFLASCTSLEFFFVAWDHQQHTVVQRAGPDRRRVKALLKWDSKWRSRRRQEAYRSADPEACERTWRAVQTILDVLNARDKISHVLMWRLNDQIAAELDASLDRTRQEAWHSIRLSLPLDVRDQIPATAPPSAVERSQADIQPAPPAIWEPDPATLPGICWHEYQHHNFNRAPDWRWNRAFAVVRHGRYWRRKRDDGPTGEATRFLRALLKKPQDRESIITTFPGMFVAHQIRTGPRDRSLELEARILARQSSEEIGRRLGISAEAVQAYHRTFFDVSDRLNARMYATKQVIGMDWARGPRHLVLEGLLKAIAYHAGPAALESALPYLRSSGQELNRLTGGDAVQDSFAERIGLLLQAAALPLNHPTGQQLVRCYPDLFRNLPRQVSRPDLLGGIAQITRPFDGILPPRVAVQTATESRAA